jgi:hypothetical protein
MIPEERRNKKRKKIRIKCENGILPSIASHPHPPRHGRLEARLGRLYLHRRVKNLSSKVGGHAQTSLFLVRAANKANINNDKKSEESHNYFEKGCILPDVTGEMSLDAPRFSDERLLGRRAGGLSWINTKFLYIWNDTSLARAFQHPMRPSRVARIGGEFWKKD